MNYLALIWADGRPAREDLAVMQRELPAFGEEMDRRGVRLFGRELELPQQTATVRVRDGETIVTDGPFAETREFIAGFDLLRCAGPEEAIEFAVKCPISRFQPIEVRPFQDGLRLDERALAFGRHEDGDAIPYLLCPWVDRAQASAPVLAGEVRAWRTDARAGGRHVLGHPLGGPESATTVRVTAGEAVLSDGPLTRIAEVMADIDVVSCADRAQAIELAATHPAARSDAIEVRPFWVG
jgi:hypothetical protein